MHTLANPHLDTVTSRLIATGNELLISNAGFSLIELCPTLLNPYEIELSV